MYTKGKSDSIFELSPIVVKFADGLYQLRFFDDN